MDHKKESKILIGIALAIFLISIISAFFAAVLFIMFIIVFAVYKSKSR